ncbi:MAG: MaoC family dehydratase [Chloroflexi bacterium]|nr:MaoC family dehydratase [Chloroflexota bacterium]
MNITQGQTAKRSLTVTAEKVTAYAEVTGDYNPLHFDEEFTSKTRFGRLMAQGGIAVGLIHALVAMDMPGPGTVFIRQEWQFTAPVYIDDTITAEATVIEVMPEKSRAKIDFVVTTQEGIEVLNGKTYVFQATPTG